MDVAPSFDPIELGDTSMDDVDEKEEAKEIPLENQITSVYNIGLLSLDTVLFHNTPKISSIEISEGKKGSCSENQFYDLIPFGIHSLLFIGDQSVCSYTPHKQQLQLLKRATTESPGKERTKWGQIQRLGLMLKAEIHLK